MDKLWTSIWAAIEQECVTVTAEYLVGLSLRRRRPLSDDSSPGFSGVHHVSLTVTDLEASIGWYERVLQAVQIGVTIPHYGCEDTGYSVLLAEPRSGLMFGLHKNIANRGDRFDEARTGLDHVSFAVAGRAAAQRVRHPAGDRAPAAGRRAGRRRLGGSHHGVTLPPWQARWRWSRIGARAWAVGCRSCGAGSPTPA